MSAATTTPPATSGPSPHEASRVVASEPICPTCGSTDIDKHGTYTRHPHGRAPVRVQRYRCSTCPSTFSPSLSYIEDGHRYPSDVGRLGRAVNSFTDASLENLQDIDTVHFGVRPSDQQIHNWIMRETGEIVENDLPEYSGIYTYDEQYLRIDGERVYRLALYDDLMDAPVGECLADRRTKEAVRDFLTQLLHDKPAYVITTDGCKEYAEIVEDDVGAFHHRCHFHFLTLLPSLVKQSRRNYSIPPYASGYDPTDSFRRDAPGGCRAASNSVPPRAARYHRRAAL